MPFTKVKAIVPLSVQACTIDIPCFVCPMLHVTAAPLTTPYTSCARIRFVQRRDHFHLHVSVGPKLAAYTICDEITRVRNSENEMQIAGL
jgi:hypothetical protein